MCPEVPGKRGPWLLGSVEAQAKTGMRVELNWFRLKGCVKCQGDLVWDDGDWLCLQCGRYYYTRLYQTETKPEWQWGQDSGPRKEKAIDLRPVLLHSYRAVESEPLGSSRLGSRNVPTAADARTGGMGFGSRYPENQ